MKTLCLLTSRLKQYFLRNRTVFILLVAGGVLIAISFAYSYGNLLWAKAHKDSQAVEYREYTVVFQEGHPDFEQVEALRSDPLIEGCVFSDTGVLYAYDGRYPLTCVSGTARLEEPYQMIAPVGGDETVGDIFAYAGKTYEIVGTATMGDIASGYYIPYETFLEEADVSQIRRIYVVSAVHEQAGDNRVMALLKDLFPTATVTGSAWMWDQMEDRQLDLMLPVILLNTFLSVVAYAFLLRHVIDSGIHHTLVSLIVGASRSKMLVLTFWETLILSAGSNGLGLLLHRLLYKPVFTKLNVIPQLRYSLQDYFYIFTVLILFSLLVILPLMVKYLKLTPAAARRKRN